MTNRYDEMSEQARELMARLDEIDLAEECASALRAARQVEAEVLRLRAGEEPPASHDSECVTPGQWIWHWNRSTPERRLEAAQKAWEDDEKSFRCFMEKHDAYLESSRAEIAELREQVEELTDAKEVYVRLMTMARAELEQVRALADRLDEEEAHGGIADGYRDAAARIRDIIGGADREEPGRAEGQPSA